jgi:hypothetical protein
MRKFRPAFPSVLDNPATASSYGVARKLIYDETTQPQLTRAVDDDDHLRFEERIASELTLFKGLMTRVSDGLADNVETLHTMRERTASIKTKMTAELDALVEEIAEADFADLFALADAMGHRPSAQERIDRMALEKSGLTVGDLHDLESTVQGSRSYKDLQNRRLALVSIIRKAIEADPKTNLKKLVEHTWHSPPKSPRPTVLPTRLDPSFVRPTVSIIHTDVRRVLLEHGAVARRTLEAQDGDAFTRAFDALVADFARLDVGDVSVPAPSLDPQDRECVRHVTDLIHAGSCWALSGFPQVTLGHRLAASLMATTIPEGLAAEIRAPWRTFVILVPPGLLGSTVYLCVCQNEEDHHEVRLLSGHIQDVVVDEGTVQSHPPFGWTSGWTIPGLAALAQPVAPVTGHTTETGVLRIGSPEESQRLTVLAQRLVLGVLLELMDPRGDGAPAPAHRPSSKSKGDRDHGMPVAWTFELRREVKIDVRPYVAAYLQGGKKAPAVQWMVRGHARRQACGKGRLGRKTIWIEPFWKGGKDLPIAVRSHRLSDRE